MIRPNLFFSLAAVVCLTSASAAHAQHAAFGRTPHPPLIQSPFAGYQPPLVEHYIEGDNRIWDENRPIERFVGDVARHSWLRLEFLMWNYRRPGDGIIGGPITGLENGVQPNQKEAVTVPVDFGVDDLNGGIAVGQTLFPTLATVDSTNVPGIRGTWGVDLNGADMELSFFGMGQKEDSFDPAIAGPRNTLALLDPLIDPTIGTNVHPNYAIPLLNNGIVPDLSDASFGTISPVNAIVFNETLSVKLESQMWGSELSFLSDRRIPGNFGPSLQWLYGARYLNLDEAFLIQGDSTGFVNSIKSTTINNLYGIQLGARWAYNLQWLTLSATPRVMFGLNDRTARVSSSVLGAADTTYRDRGIEFGTLTQLNLAAEITLSSHFSIYGGYEFLWLPSITRPYENIVYDTSTDLAGTTSASIREHTNYTAFYAQGFNVGAVFRY